MNNKLPLALAIGLVSGSALALQSLDDAVMQDVSGQGGLTIESTTTDPDGYTLRTGEIRYTQKNNEGGLDAYFSIDGMTERYYTSDAAGNFIGLNTVRTLINVDSAGNLSIKTEDVDTKDIHYGAMSFSGRQFLSGMDINVWKFKPGSYTEIEAKNDPAGAKIISRTVMKNGSGYTQKRYENDVIVSSKTAYCPDPCTGEYRSETILTNDAGNGLKLEFGATNGTIEIQDIKIARNINGTVVGLFDDNSFGDIGYGDISVNSGYVTMRANADPSKNGLQGQFASDIDVGTFFFRTDNSRINMHNLQFKTVGPIDYNLALMNNGYATGIEAQIHGVGSTAELRVGSITLSSKDGSGETTSAGSFAITGFTLNNGTAEISNYTLPGYGTDGLRQVVNASGKTSFNLEVYDESSAAGAPKLSAEVVLNNFTQDQTTNYTPKGIYILTGSNSMDVNINAIRVGNGSTYKGQSGRIVMNNYHVMPGSYTNIEPLR